MHRDSQKTENDRVKTYAYKNGIKNEQQFEHDENLKKKKMRERRRLQCCLESS